MLKTYRICNSTVRFSKYKFYYKLLDGITFLRIIPGVAWTQHLYIYIYMCVCVYKLLREGGGDDFMTMTIKENLILRQCDYLIVRFIHQKLMFKINK